ncbi:MAG: exodeoxyribonuclease VII large subunit [bacterium]|nr:exodeoxyribonuclease VII large subunit [bacterium]
MRILTVSEFLAGINEVLASVPALVEGEVSGYSMSQGKWAFFSLKDDASVVPCFMPAWKLRHVIEDGMVVRIAGVPRVYEKSGKFSITVEALEPSGEGSLKRAFQLLVEKLEREGLFDVSRKRPLPRFPERIGLIASADSAAYSDFLRILGDRWGGVEVSTVDVRVQGEGAVDDVCTAFRTCASAGGVDVIVLTRGGGSLEDLQAFNSEEIARAIFACPIPVVVGVGHERDTTIADLVADVRASTPSNAAERVVPDRHAIAQELRMMEQGIAGVMLGTIADHRAIIERFSYRGTAFAHARSMRVEVNARTIVHAMDDALRSFARRREDAEQRMGSRLAERCATLTAQVIACTRLLEGLNPERVLERGYSVTTVGGRVVRHAMQLRAGDELRTRFAVGSAVSTVTRTE